MSTSAAIYCFKCATPIILPSGGDPSASDVQEGTARCSQCGASYLITIAMLRGPERDVEGNRNS